jgi:hypothetical protein
MYHIPNENKILLALVSSIAAGSPLSLFWRQGMVGLGLGCTQCCLIWYPVFQDPAI